MKSKFLFLLFLVVANISFAQNITGHWYGVGKVEMPDNTNSYLSELVLVQNGKLITGELNYYFRDSLFNNKITGSFNASTRILTIKPTAVIYHRATSTVNGVDCPMTGEFILRVAKAESVLTGSLYSNKDFKYTCPPINFKLKKNTDTIAFVEEVKVVKKDTVATKKEATTETSEEKEKQEQFKTREKVFAREIEVSNNNLKLEFYDNGAIDYDSIAVFFNGKMILPKSKLDHRAIRLSIKFDESLPFNELSMFAESVGMIPPNTAALIIYDGSIRHEILMTSDFTKNGTIKLVKKKE